MHFIFVIFKNQSRVYQLLFIIASTYRHSTSTQRDDRLPFIIYFGHDVTQWPTKTQCPLTTEQTTLITKNGARVFKVSRRSGPTNAECQTSATELVFVRNKKMKRSQEQKFTRISESPCNPRTWIYDASSRERFPSAYITQWFPWRKTGNKKD